MGRMLLGLAVVLVGGEARAEGITLGLATGYAAPFGSTSVGVPMSQSATGAVPVLLEVGARIDRRVELLAFGELSLLIPSCDGTASCSGTSASGGIEARFHFLRLLWVGLGSGLELLSVNASGGGINASSTLFGLQPLRVAMGAAVSPWAHVHIGPFARFASGVFASSSENLQGLENDSSIARRAAHYWLTVGVEVRWEQ
jgi:hypothetical protein